MGPYTSARLVGYEGAVVDSTITGEMIRLTVPASLEYVRIVRLTASGVASRLGFDIEDLEDLRVAVDELSSLLVEAVDGGELTVNFAVLADALRIEGEAMLPADRAERCRACG